MKIIRNIFLSILAALITLILVGVILTKVFEGEVIAFIINEINRELTAEISVQNATFSLIRKFPDATIIFNKVQIRSKQQDSNALFSDTLLVADKIMLSFNILEIAKKQYLLQDIHIVNGSIQILINNQGAGNFNIWNRRPGPGPNQLQVDLQQVRITNSDLLFQDDATSTYLSLHSDKIDMNVHFSGNGFNAESNLQGTIRTYRRDGITYIRDQKVAIDLMMDKGGNRLRINKAVLILDKIHLTGEGEIIQKPEKIADIQVKGEDIRFGTVIKYLPVLKKKIPSDLNYNGQFDILLRISGPVSKTNMPHIEAVYKIENAGINYRKKKLQIEKINLSGIYNNGLMNNAESTVIIVKDFSAVFRNSFVSGNLNIRNLKEPEIECTLENQLNLEDITDLYSPGFLKFSGNLSSILNIRGQQKELTGFDKKDLNNFSYKGSVQVRNMQAFFQGMEPVASNINANFSIDKYLIINKLTGNIFNNELNISGRIDNFMEYFVSHSGNLWADLIIYSEDFNLDSVFTALNDHSLNNTQSSKQLPESMFIKLKFWFNQFSFSSFKGTDITGDLFYKPGILTVNHFSGSTMKGSVIAKGSLELNNETNYIVRCNSVINNVEIKDVFTSFNNFGQDFLQDRHIKGDLSGSIDFYGEFDKNFKISLPSILTDGDLVIRNGELIGFEPMEKLSKFINLEELSHIHFSDLKNEIYISKSKVIIPQMEINSSAINLTGSGIHGFDNYYNYKIKLSLSEVLSKKLRSGRQSDSTHVIIADENHGRTSIYLSIDGNPSGMKVSYDKEAALNGFREKMKGEKNLMKSIIDEEIGKADQDSERDIRTEKGDKQKFLLDWKETDEPLKKQDTASIVKKEKFILEWEEDTLR